MMRPGPRGAPIRTDAFNELVLSGDARADSQPQLEIYADDVKCSTAPPRPIDQTALFYLRSRVWVPRRARAVLTRIRRGHSGADRPRSQSAVELDEMIRSRLLAGAREAAA